MQVASCHGLGFLNVFTISAREKKDIHWYWLFLLWLLRRVLRLQASVTVLCYWGSCWFISWPKDSKHLIHIVWLALNKKNRTLLCGQWITTIPTISPMSCLIYACFIYACFTYACLKWWYVFCGKDRNTEVSQTNKQPTLVVLCNTPIFYKYPGSRRRDSHWAIPTSRHYIVMFSEINVFQNRVEDPVERLVSANTNVVLRRDSGFKHIISLREF